MHRPGRSRPARLACALITAFAACWLLVAAAAAAANAPKATAGRPTVATGECPPAQLQQQQQPPPLQVAGNGSRLHNCHPSNGSGALRATAHRHPGAVASSTPSTSPTSTPAPSTATSATNLTQNSISCERVARVLADAIRELKARSPSGADALRLPAECADGSQQLPAAAAGQPLSMAEAQPEAAVGSLPQRLHATLAVSANESAALATAASSLASSPAALLELNLAAEFNAGQDEPPPKPKPHHSHSHSYSNSNLNSNSNSNSNSPPTTNLQQVHFGAKIALATLFALIVLVAVATVADLYAGTSGRGSRPSKGAQFKHQQLHDQQNQHVIAPQAYMAASLRDQRSPSLSSTCSSSLYCASSSSSSSATSSASASAPILASNYGLRSSAVMIQTAAQHQHQQIAPSRPTWYKFARGQQHDKRAQTLDNSSQHLQEQPQRQYLDNLVDYETRHGCSDALRAAQNARRHLACEASLRRVSNRMDVQKPGPRKSWRARLRDLVLPELAMQALMAFSLRLSAAQIFKRSKPSRSKRAMSSRSEFEQAPQCQSNKMCNQANSKSASRRSLDATSHSSCAAYRMRVGSLSSIDESSTCMTGLQSSTETVGGRSTGSGHSSMLASTDKVALMSCKCDLFARQHACDPNLQPRTRHYLEHSQPRDEQQSIDALHGLRFLSMIWIIVIHSYNFALSWLFFTNTSTLDDLYKTSASQLLANGTFACDSFLFAGGFLLPYLTFGSSSDASRREEARDLSTCSTHSSCQCQHNLNNELDNNNSDNHHEDDADDELDEGEHQRDDIADSHLNDKQRHNFCNDETSRQQDMSRLQRVQARHGLPARDFISVQMVAAEQASGDQRSCYQQETASKPFTTQTSARHAELHTNERPSATSSTTNTTTTITSASNASITLPSSLKTRNHARSTTPPATPATTSREAKNSNNNNFNAHGFTLKRVLLNLLHRYIRMTPLMMAIIGLSATLLRYLGEGPAWDDSTMMFDKWCRKNWWINALFLHNFVDRENMCLSHSWYSAVDIQLFLVGQLIMYVLFRSKKLGLLLLVALLVGAQLITGILTLIHHLPAVPLIASFSEQSMNMYYGEIYIKPYCRASPYLIGLLLAYLMRTTRLSQLKISKWQVCLGWTLSIVTLFSILMAMKPAMNGQPPSELESALYSALSRPLWACATGWIIFACMTKRGGLLGAFLSARCFVPFSRLTYPAFLIHPIVMAAFYGSRQSSFQFSHYLMLYLILGNIVITYASAFILSALFELPILSIERAVKRAWKGTKGAAGAREAQREQQEHYEYPAQEQRQQHLHEQHMEAAAEGPSSTGRA